MNTALLTLIRCDSTDPDFIALVRLLDQDLKIRNGEEHGFYDQFNKIDAIKNVVVAYQNSTAVGCGAFKEFSSGTVEIKRMFVPLELRGRGIAGQVLNELQNWARELGYGECVLETGKKQPEAIRLYEKSGYALIPNFGPYIGIENSVCMKKKI